MNQSQELHQIPRISQALVVLDPDLDLEHWHPHPELNAVLQRRQDPDTPKGLQSTIAGKAVVRSSITSRTILTHFAHAHCGCRPS